MQEWQPIETAPSDKLVLVAFETDTGRKIVGSSFRSNITGGWIWTLLGSGGACISPTHWMPLPEPPK